MGVNEPLWFATPDMPEENPENQSEALSPLVEKMRSLLGVSSLYLAMWNKVYVEGRMADGHFKVAHVPVTVFSPP